MFLIIIKSISQTLSIAKSMFEDRGRSPYEAQLVLISGSQTAILVQVKLHVLVHLDSFLIDVFISLPLCLLFL